jgi:hypothetical protein
MGKKYSSGSGGGRLMVMHQSAALSSLCVGIGVVVADRSSCSALAMNTARYLALPQEHLTWIAPVPPKLSTTADGYMDTAPHDNNQPNHHLIDYLGHLFL